MDGKTHRQQSGMPSFLFVLVCGVVSPLAARKRTSVTLGMVNSMTTQINTS